MEKKNQSTVVNKSQTLLAVKFVEIYKWKWEFWEIQKTYKSY